MDKLSGYIFIVKMMNYQKNITVFGIKSVIVLWKSLIANRSTVKDFWTFLNIHYLNNQTLNVYMCLTCLSKELEKLLNTKNFKVKYLILKVLG